RQNASHHAEQSEHDERSLARNASGRPYSQAEREEPIDQSVGPEEKHEHLAGPTRIGESQHAKENSDDAAQDHKPPPTLQGFQHVYLLRFLRLATHDGYGMPAGVGL